MAIASIEHLANSEGRRAWFERPGWQSFFEESGVAGGEDVFAGEPQKPEVEIAGQPGDGHNRAVTGDRERERAVRALRLERVAQDFFGQARFAEDERQGVLERIAGRALKSEAVLIDLALGDDVFGEEVVIGEAAAEVVVMPADFALDPGIAFDGELDALVFPCGAAWSEKVWR